ncbi:MAG: CPBP family intramembrane metalloprotease [Alistipes sp.]|nr:CPBP family intramembrane metalloprotease [Alistipes sp.]
MLELKPKMFKEAEKSSASENIIVNILIFIAVFVVVMLLESVIPAIMTMPEIMSRISEEGLLGVNADTQRITEISTEVSMKQKYLIPTLFCTAFAIAGSLIYCRFIEARHLSSMGLRKRKAAAHYFQGFIVGIIMMSALVGISWLCGAVDITVCKNVNYGAIGLFFLGFLIQGASEEFMFHGYFMNTLGSRFHWVIAVGVSAAAFSLAHIANPGYNLLVFFNLALFGAFAGLYMICFDDIWGVCAIHFIWNFTQGCVFGISVSGTGETESVLRTTASSGSALLTGGDFGIEGSIFTTIVLLAAIALVMMKIIKSNKKISE